jgi:hypothetical protein
LTELIGAPVKAATNTTVIFGALKCKRRNVVSIEAEIIIARKIWTFLKYFVLSRYFPRAIDPAIPVTQLIIAAIVCSFKLKTYLSVNG